ncbi:MAG: SDR family NAD(P)-dependent oxidoreductase [Alloprevotella sp.]|nr:SDR family NAD(P)-dependent oxidoreductase [Alloprevotella sp.]
METTQPVKKALVMGATSGIGKEVAHLLAMKGWQLALAGRRIDVLRQLQSEWPGIRAVAQIDLTDSQAPTLIRQLIDTMGSIDLYFHSSGIGFQNVALDPEKEERTVATNAVGFTRALTAVFNHCTSDPSQPLHIAVISSIARTKGLGAAPAYSATKRFQSHYVEGLQQLAAIRRLPVTFTDVRPGFVDTALIEGSDFPLKLQPARVARQIVRAVERRRSVVTIDWRYRLLVAAWRLVPRWLWVRLPIRR